jgi:nucleoside-diphosphate-sugar epimerase
MTGDKGIAVVTGASGYVGSRICSTLSARGWSVVRLVRSPTPASGASLRFDIAAPIDEDVRKVLQSADVLVHAAYDFSVTSRADIWRINVEGTRTLLQEARRANVRRILVLSSMSAFEGTSQLYGQAKLAIEEDTMAAAGCAIRPGVVIGAQPGGMAGALKKLASLPVAPTIAGNPRQYVVREDDLMAVIAALAASERAPVGPIGVACPIAVPFRDLLEAVRPGRRRRPLLVPVPWRLVYWLLRMGETLGIRPPFRSDSLLGLVHSAQNIPGSQELAQLGITPRAVFPHPDADEQRQSLQTTGHGRARG